MRGEGGVGGGGVLKIDSVLYNISLITRNSNKQNFSIKFFPEQ